MPQVLLKPLGHADRAPNVGDLHANDSRRLKNKARDAPRDLEKRLKEIMIAFHAADWTLSIDFATNTRINEQSASKHRNKTAGQKNADFWPMNAKDRLSMKIY